jgi:cyanophycin synthetase
MRLGVGESIDFAVLDRLMANYILEAPPEDAGDGNASRLVRRIVFWAGALQRQAQIPVFGRAYIHGPHNSGKGDAFRVALPCYAPQATTAAMDWVAGAVNTYLATGELHDVPADEAHRQFAELTRTLKRYSPSGVNTYRLLATASELDIPVRQLLSGVFAFGHGARSRWLDSTYTDRTALIAARIAGNKYLTSRMLRSAGLAAPIHELVRSSEEAVEAAGRLGYPVVVKPADRSQGRGVAANLTSEQGVAAAFAEAAKISKQILVEKHFDGTELRVTVFGGKTFRVAARSAGGVTGDGKSTIAELVTKQQQSPLQQRRMRERGHVLVQLDEEAMQLLAEAGLSPGSVLAEGRYQRLRRRANVSAGGMLVDVAIADVHPDNLSLAERAVAVLRLDLGGVDVILPDLSRSWIETGGLICEVNPQPQIGRRHMPDLLSEMLQGDGRIPVLLVIGSAAGLRREDILAKAPWAGLASADGLWLGSRRIAGPQPDGFAAGETVVGLPEAEAAVILISPEEVAQSGLPVDRCDLLVLEAPDRWDDKARRTQSDILEIALPNAGRAVYLQPAQTLLGAHQDAGRLEPAGSDSLQHLIDQFMMVAARSAATGEDSSERPFAAGRGPLPPTFSDDRASFG